MSHAWRGHSLPLNHTNDQVNAPIQAGSFEHPSANVRPRFIYWIPDGSINTTLFAAQLAERGAGGIEFLNYFDCGGLVGNGPATDWNIYGYGTPAYRNGLGELISALTFAVTKSKNFTTVISDTAFIGTATIAGSVNSTRHTIASSSITDVSKMMQADGSITVTTPTVDGASAYYLFTSYYRFSYDRASIASDPHPQNILQNGSFTLYILIDGIDDLRRKVGNYIWEDSVQVPGQDSIEKYVPLLAGRNGQLNQPAGVDTHLFVLDTDDRGSSIVGDWRETMGRLLGTYYNHLANWTNSYLDF
ncbi:hypothetical protein IFR05_004326 [Cadophora sp. M221]|nr:hypothetical protein IFR05_004326 [Cadophora sp. M221]